MGSQNRDVEKERYWQKIIGEAVRSGMSIREFCRQRRLKVSQFYWWQRRLNRLRKNPGFLFSGSPARCWRAVLG